jgi:ubiquinone/menaquinone biosynthesis C-methylase UbiE
MGRLKAVLYDAQMRLAADALDPLRKDVVSPAMGRVLELGVGTGLNLRFYAPGTQVVAIEPDPAMLRRAGDRRNGAKASVQLISAAAEALPFPDGVFDEVVATLVFCSVRSPALSLREVRRVLKPGGRLRFMEHVRSPDARWAAMQDLVTPLWKLIADGCCPNRPTLDSIRQAGFDVKSVERYPLGPYPVRPQVRGIAVRANP